MCRLHFGASTTVPKAKPGNRATFIVSGPHFSPKGDVAIGAPCQALENRSFKEGRFLRHFVVCEIAARLDHLEIVRQSHVNDLSKIMIRQTTDRELQGPALLWSSVRLSESRFQWAALHKPWHQDVKL